MPDSRRTSQRHLSSKAHVSQLANTPWKKVRLGDVAKVIVSNVDKKTKAGEQPVRLCNYTDVYKRDTIDPGQDFMTATATLAEIEKYALKIGDVIITKDSEVADDIAVPAYVAETSDDLVCGYHLAIIRPNTSLSGRFMKYYFELPRTRYYFGSRSSGVTRFGLTIEGIKDALIRLPSEKEQGKIAEILGACDEAIEAQERLITQKQERKKGLMQRLLTGKTRFPQFAGKPWKEVRLEDILRKEKGKVVNPTGKGLPIIGATAFDGDFDQFSDDPDAVRVNETDLLILWDGYAGKTTTGKIGLASSTVVVGRPKVDLSMVFVDAFLKINNPRIRAIREGSAIPHLPADFFRWQRIPFPPIAEQTAIAAILSAQDEEIDLQQKKLEHLKQQKKGLMQRLLTGKVRVKV